MTRKELADKYGASDADVAKVVQTFAQFGLKAVATSTATRSVRLSGTVAQLEVAFQVKLFHYQFPERPDEIPYRGRVGTIQVPTQLKDIVQGVFGLDNRRVARRRRHPGHRLGAARARSSMPSSWYIPSELATHYNFPTGDGTGEVVAVFEFGGGYFEDDLRSFCQAAGVTMPQVTAISVDGTSTSAHDGTEGETMLDVEVIAGACPGAKVVAYFADFSEQGWMAILDYVMQDHQNNPGVVSISWGSPEIVNGSIWTAEAINQINEALKEAAYLGITICVAAGDDGSSDAVMDGLAHADFPASSEYVLAVGGTTIPVKGGNGPDVVWFEGDGLRSSGHGSTGGAVSAVIPRPTWQSGINIQSVNPGAIAGRIIPDISANADWDASPYLLVVDNGQQPNGGTSAATPLIASLLTLINASRGASARVGYVTPVLYQAVGGGAQTVGSSGCTDIVSGNNVTAQAGGYYASPGYDAVSGWGTPNGVNLTTALATVLPSSGVAAQSSSSRRVDPPRDGPAASKAIPKASRSKAR
jgi:kumamolisin